MIPRIAFKFCAPVILQIHGNFNQCLLIIPSILCLAEGRVFVNFEHRHNFSEAEIVRQNPYIQPGGLWRPTACVARHRVAVIIPYRDRWEHLMILLSHLHPILERQQLDYRIFVVEQVSQSFDFFFFLISPLFLLTLQLK